MNYVVLGVWFILLTVGCVGSYEPPWFMHGRLKNGFLPDPETETETPHLPKVTGRAKDHRKTSQL